MIAKKSCEHGKYGSFEYLHFLFFLLIEKQTDVEEGDCRVEHHVKTRTKHVSLRLYQIFSSLEHYENLVSNEPVPGLSRSVQYCVQNPVS